MRWIRLRFYAPLAAFGDVIIDSHGGTRDFPGQSLIVGLLANALGWTRSMRKEHQELQERIIFGAIRESEPILGRTTDYQTAKLEKRDKAWTTQGVPSTRDGGPKTYVGSHQRWREYHSDSRTSVVIRLDPNDDFPTLDDVATALVQPARPLFIGRKSCLPSMPIFNGWVNSPDVYTALCSIVDIESDEVRAQWPASEGTVGAFKTIFVTDERNWITGLHGGARQVCEGKLHIVRD